ncbi:SCO2102 family sporulation regulator [Streptomyces sp. NPDC001443]
MGWTVLYIAFGIVALWLLGEVLLQYKARLRWRLLAFGGFLGVVLGVLIPSVIVIGLGAAAFAVGQTYVTLSFRRGFAAGWAVKRPDEDDEGIAGVAGFARRRGRAEEEDSDLEVSGQEALTDGYDDGDHADDKAAYAPEKAAYLQDAGYERDDVFTADRSGEPAAAESTAVYEPQPMPDDTGSYGVYGDNNSYAATGQPQDQYATAAQGADQSYSYDGYSGYQQYGYDTTGQQQYAAYSDPYIGTQTYGGGTSYDTSGYGNQYGQQNYGQDQYAGYGGETPAGGVWVPQQRSTDGQYAGEQGQEQQQYPYQGDGQQQGNGYDEQYRF